MDIGSDEGARVESQFITELEIGLLQISQRAIKRVETDRADLAEWQMHRDHDRGDGHRPFLEIGQVDPRQIEVRQAGMEASGIDPEHIAFEPAGRGNR